ncbi:MAG: hypothetical protein ACOCQG_06400 [Candidatus Nanoarchaeia archaeon]
MEECENLAKCPFFKTYQDDPNYSIALEGFAKHYCRGDMQEQCVRKKVSKALGGPDKVPVNMMPDGRSLPETSSEDWPDNVKELISG